MAQYLQEPSKNGAGRLIAGTPEMCAIAAAHPALWEHLSECVWESGQPRVTSTLMVFVEDGLVKLCLHDRASARSSWVSGKTLSGALGVLETQLEQHSVEWRKDRAQGKR